MLTVHQLMGARANMALAEIGLDEDITVEHRRGAPAEALYWPSGELVGHHRKAIALARLATLGPDAMAICDPCWHANACRAFGAERCVTVAEQLMGMSCQRWTCREC